MEKFALHFFLQMRDFCLISLDAGHPIKTRDRPAGCETVDSSDKNESLGANLHDCI